MRWQNPKHGDVRIKKKFALLPIEINGENRWLEWVKIKYVYHYGTVFREKRDHGYYRYYGWRAEEFIDEDNT